MRLVPDFIAAGGNRHPSAADWAPGLLAFGAGNQVALWDPDAPTQTGIFALLNGHTDVVNAVKIYPANGGKRLILSGSADQTVRIWEPTNHSCRTYTTCAVLSLHNGSINTIAILPSHELFVTGAADGTAKVWKFQDTSAQLIQDILLRPRYFPLASAMINLTESITALVIAGTSSAIQVYVSSQAEAPFVLQTTLTGHEGWVRSLDFAALEAENHSHEDSHVASRDFLLASASQDKYVRLWRFRQGAGNGPNGDVDPSSLAASTPLSNKAYEVGDEQTRFTVAFEALLVGHEDWIYTARWSPESAESHSPRLLSASADNSISVWRADEGSGIWVCDTRLGDISSQKGSTTATGSTGGFWNGLWQPPLGQSVVSLSGTGSWRIWSYDKEHDKWNQRVGISGHVEAVQDLSWSPDGSYLLTTSSDQTTRLFAESTKSELVRWHEMARPQIHGYDLNCIATITETQFISGADEKLLRVFDMPRNVRALISQLSGSGVMDSDQLPQSAQIPVLGLSNVAVAASSPEDGAIMVNNEHYETNAVNGPPLDSAALSEAQGHPPFEDDLARHTLWPEHEKLYGHGYEISAVATSHDGQVVATTCKASSIDHAVIRLYETQHWREIKPPLAAHALTVTALAFSSKDRYLLSVGRDRQWTLFERESEASTTYNILTKNPKGHSRMILGCAFAPIETENVFATAGRDKMVKIWQVSGAVATCCVSITAGAAVTSVAFSQSKGGQEVFLAYGTEQGSVYIFNVNTSSFEVTPLTDTSADEPTKAITAMQWRTGSARHHKDCGSRREEEEQLAVASEDFSVKIYSVLTDIGQSQER